MLFLEGDISQLIATGILFGILILNIFFYLKVKNPIFMLAIVGFSLFFVFGSLGVDIPLAPYTQIFVLVFNAILFISKIIKK